MYGVQQKKVPGGKLIQVEVTFDDCIQSVLISGDFFAHPEEGIKELEESLKGISKETDFVKHIEEQTKDIELVGIDAETIAQLIQEAIQCGA